MEDFTVIPTMPVLNNFVKVKVETTMCLCNKY